MDLAMLNKCQMYMRTIHLFDICNTIGDKEQYCWNQLMSVGSPYRWPMYPKTTPRTGKLGNAF